MSQAVVRDPSLWCARRITVSLRAAEGEPETIELARPFARVGSHPDCEIVLPSQEVPPLAVYLHATPVGGYGLKLASDEIEIHAAGRGRRRGLTVRIGRHTLDVRFAREESLSVVEPVAPPTDSARSPLWPRLEIEVPGEHRPVVRRLSRALTVVGRQPPSRLLLRHATVARTHSVLHWDGARLWVVNLLSPNGTRLVLPFARLGREWIDSGEVRLGDGLMLGDVRMRFIDVVEAEDRPPVSREPRGPRAERRRSAELAERCGQLDARCRRLARIAAEFRHRAKANATSREAPLNTPSSEPTDEAMAPSEHMARVAQIAHRPPEKFDSLRSGIRENSDSDPRPRPDFSRSQLRADVQSGLDAKTPTDMPAQCDSPSLGGEVAAALSGDSASSGGTRLQPESTSPKTVEGWSHERLIDSFVAEQRRVRRRRLLWIAAFVVPLLATAGYVFSRPDVRERIEPLRELWHEITQAVTAE